MAEETLQSCKKRLSHQYLGKVGIHGVSVRSSEKAIYLYISSPDSSKQQNLISKIKKEAAPYKVVTVREERPTFKED